MSTSWFACENCQTPTIRWIVPNQNKKLYVQGPWTQNYHVLSVKPWWNDWPEQSSQKLEFNSLCFPIRLFDLFVLFHRASFLSAASRRVKEFRSNRLKTIAGLRGIGKNNAKEMWRNSTVSCVLISDIANAYCWHQQIPHEQLECYATSV